MRHKNAARVMPKFGLTVEKRPGAAIKGGSTRIHLLADSELIQVKKSAAPVTARIPPEEAPSPTDSQSSDCRLLPLESVTSRHWSSSCQRFKKASQSVGVNSEEGGNNNKVHPTGTPIFKYRRNHIFHMWEANKGKGGIILNRLAVGHSAPSSFLIQAVELLPR